MRFHLGARGIGYSRSALEKWAERVREWSASGLDVFLYFNNDMEGYAIKDAETLAGLLR